MPPFWPAAVGRTQASTETALATSSTVLGAPTNGARVPGKVAAVSPLTAPGCPNVTPESTATVRPFPLASAAVVLPGGSPRRQNPIGRSARSCCLPPPASITPSPQPRIWPLHVHVPWLGVASPRARPAGNASCPLLPVAPAGPLPFS